LAKINPASILWQSDCREGTQRGCRNQGEEVRPKEIKEMMGRGMSGRGITQKDFLPIPVPIIPLPNLCARR
jgi:hypothetical protein